MSMLLAKLSNIFAVIKQVILEQLWLFGILVPLLVLGILGVMRSTGRHHQAEVVLDIPHQYLRSQSQLSPLELSRIVSLPLMDLMNIEIYIEVGSNLLRGDLIMMSSLPENKLFLVFSQELMLSNRSRRNRADELICDLYCNTKNNEEIVELA